MNFVMRKALYGTFALDMILLCQSTQAQNLTFLLEISSFSLYNRGGRITHHVDLDSYAGWSCILLVGPPKSDRLRDRGQTK